MKNSKNKYSVKKSSGVQSTQMLKLLQKAIATKEASVSYIFVNERIDLNSPDMDTYEEVSRLHVNLPAEALEKKTPNDIIRMLETTKSDLGANYFILS